MIYQKIFTGDSPYHIGIGSLPEYPEHRHADLELNFCISGSFQIVIDGKNYRVEEGCTTFIPPMCSHSIPREDQCRAITVIAGISLLNSYFNEFLKLALTPGVFELNSEVGERIKELFCECADVMSKNSTGAELIIMGNIYKILAYFLETLSDTGNGASVGNDFARIEEIEKAIEMIRFNYKEPLTVEFVAERIGYSKSNFCKIFKRFVGEGFHQALNRHRVECAAGLLRASRMSVSEISSEVGFSDAKSFCRVFKSIYGVTPGQYRKT